MKSIKFNYPLKKLTTIKIGGPAKYFINVKSEEELLMAIKWAKESKVKCYVIGQGSNLIPSYKGFNGLIIKNEISDIKAKGKEVTVGVGFVLLDLINRLNKLGLSGMEKMAGIPGTVGGAIYGSVGAYGQEVKDNLVRVKIFDGNRTRWLTKDECLFKYRDSIFKKKKDWIIIEAKFKLKKAEPKDLSKISSRIIKIRERKYPPNLLCPGSFFKNIIIRDIKPTILRKKFLSKIPIDMINQGKVSAGYLLESVGAKSIKRGKIKVAKYHGNLIYNSGGGKSNDIIKLAKILKNKVKNRFGISLTEEVQYL